MRFDSGPEDSKSTIDLGRVSSVLCRIPKRKVRRVRLKGRIRTGRPKDEKSRVLPVHRRAQKRTEDPARRKDDF